MDLPSYTTDVDYRTQAASLRDDPADDTARLVLADWVQDHGDNDEAAAIRGRYSLTLDVLPAFRRGERAMNDALATFVEVFAALYPSIEQAARVMARDLAPLVVEYEPPGSTS